MKTLKNVMLFGLIAAVAIAFAPMTSIFAEEVAPADVVLTGEPVDLNCYLGGKSGEGHAACATACANKGNPIGFVVTKDGESTLYLVLADGGKASKDLMAAHMGKQVSVTGKASKKEGMNIIVASSVSTDV